MSPYLLGSDNGCGTVRNDDKFIIPTNVPARFDNCRFFDENLQMLPPGKFGSNSCWLSMACFGMSLVNYSRP